MLKWRRTAVAVALGGSLTIAPLAGCESLPGDPGTQGAVIGGAGGAAAGGMIAEDSLLGALIGGALGAGGGYLIGANWENITGENEEGAREAAREAQIDPATAEDVRDAVDADLNSDGFVTMDEVIAMSDAGLSDAEMIARLEASGQIFELTNAQQQYLRDQGVSSRVVGTLPTINQDQRQELLEERSRGDEVIGQPAPADPVNPRNDDDLRWD